LNRFSNESESESSDQGDQTNWFLQIRNIIREFLARKIEENIYNNRFDFEDIYFRR